MIGVPFEDNDLNCLGWITEIVASMVNPPDPALVDLAARYPTTELLASWIRSLPQRDDEGVRGDNPKVEECRPPQRLRIPAPDPNCVERAALYLAVAELIDPYPVRRLSTLDYEWGRHTFPIEEGSPVVLDPRATYEELVQAVQIEERERQRKRNRGRPRITSRTPAPGSAVSMPPGAVDDSMATGVPPAADASNLPVAPRAPLAIDVNDAMDFTTQLALQAAAGTRNGPSRAYRARNAIQNFVNHGIAPPDPPTVESIGWFFSMAERVANDYGPRALAIVRTTALAISGLIDDILAQKGQQGLPRNLSFEIGGTSFGVPSWLSGLGSLVGKIGLDVGAVALAPKLAALGISGQMLELVEQELNAEGLSLGPLVNPKRSFSSALSSLSGRRPT